MVQYTCDVCGTQSTDYPDNLHGEDIAGNAFWTMQLCGKTDCLVAALTKMHEPQGIKGFRYYQGFRERQPQPGQVTNAQV